VPLDIRWQLFKSDVTTSAIPSPLSSPSHSLIVTHRMSLVDHLLDIVLSKVSVTRIVQRFDITSRLELGDGDQPGLRAIEVCQRWYAYRNRYNELARSP
jgi:hypothetical protein